jgi:hypothetical protein
MCQLTKSSQILNNPQTSLPIRNRRIKIMLLPMLIHTKTLKIYIPARPKLRLHGSRDVNWALHIELLHTAFHNAELEGYHARHLNRAAEGDLAIALAEMQVSDTEFSAGDVNGQENLGATREVLDVAVSAVFGAAGDSPRAFFADLLFQVTCSGTGMHILWLRGLGNGTVEMGVCGDEFAFTLVPGIQDFLRGRAA